MAHSTATSRLRQLATTTDRVQKLGRMAMAARGLRHDDPQRRARAQHSLASLMADARGIPMKIGQILAGGAQGQAFAELVHGIDPLPLSQIKPLLSEAWAQPWDEVLQWIDEAEHAASIGQVHRACLKSGREVAIKIQYPDIGQAIEAEMRLVGLMPGIGPVQKWGFDLDGYRRELRENLTHELDYRREAATQARFYACSRGITGLVIPQVIEAWTRTGVLMQSWEQGQEFTQASTLQPEKRRRLAQILVRQLMAGLFDHGSIHGDPHFGNLKVRDGHSARPKLVQYDFGCTIAVAPERRRALLRLILATRGESLGPTDLLDTFACLGFEPGKLTTIADRLSQLCRVLFLPFCVDGPFDARSWRLGSDVETILGDDRWWFRSAGPPDLFLMLRAFQGLVAQLEHLDSDVDWWRALRDCTSRELMQSARTWQVPPSPRRPARMPACEFGQAASRMHIEVRVDGQEKVALSMPALAALDLEQLIPVEIRPALERKQIRLTEIRDRIVASGLAPVELFELHEGNKSYRVWLA